MFRYERARTHSFTRRWSVLPAVPPHPLLLHLATFQSSPPIPSQFPVNGLDLSPYVVKDEASTGGASGGSGGCKETDDRTHPNTPYHSAEGATAEAAAAAAAAAAAVAGGYGSSAGERVPDASSAPEVASSTSPRAAGAGAGGDDGAGDRCRVDGGGRAEGRRNWSSSDKGRGDDAGMGGSPRVGGRDGVERSPGSTGCDSGTAVVVPPSAEGGGGGVKVEGLKESTEEGGTVEAGLTSPGVMGANVSWESRCSVEDLHDIFSAWRWRWRWRCSVGNGLRGARMLVDAANLLVNMVNVFASYILVLFSCFICAWVFLSSLLALIRFRYRYFYA